jgi:hypothetical protein
VAVITLACVVLVVVAALVVGLFASNDVVDSDKVFEIVGPAFNMVIGAFVGLLGGLSLNANARDAKPEEPAPVEPEPLPAPEPAPMAATPEPTPATEDDDDMAPWEKYRNDLRYDANGDGVVDEDDFPDWRNPRA